MRNQSHNKGESQRKIYASTFLQCKEVRFGFLEMAITCCHNFFRMMNIKSLKKKFKARIGVDAAMLV